MPPTNLLRIPALEQLRWLKQLVKKDYHYMSFKKKKTRADALDILKTKSDHPAVVIPLSVDGGVSHSITE